MIEIDTLALPGGASGVCMLALPGGASGVCMYLFMVWCVHACVCVCVCRVMSNWERIHSHSCVVPYEK